MATKRQVIDLPRIAVTRDEAARMLGISRDVLKNEQAAGRLKAKNTKFDHGGRPIGRTLYDPAELRRWFESLGDS